MTTDFTVTEPVIESEQKEIVWTLTALDRCDTGECGAQAYVKVTGVSGELLFCLHHYNKTINNPDSNKKLEAFAFNTVDERDRLIENRLLSDD